jgi:predicted RNase H-like HicB family nuclease
MLLIHDIIKINLSGRRLMLTEYIQKALEKAHYKFLEDGTWFAEIPGFQGVWANATTVEECRHELTEVLEEWLVLKIRDRDPIPEIEGVSIRIKEVAAA